MKKKFELIIALLGIVIIVLVFFLFKKNPSSIPNTTIPKENVVNTPITSTNKVTEESIKEENFIGTKSIITGSGVLADSARSYIDTTVASFKQSADEEVPDMRAKFGADAPTAKYEIDLKATYIKNPTTTSIVIDQYVYTGGANGDSSYKVFTASNKTDKILALSDIIIPSKQDVFTAFMKKQLLAWKPNGSKYSPVFEDEVSALTFDSFPNWSLGGKNLIIYFDKFAIGPGTLGAVAFPVPISKVQEFLINEYK